MIKVVLSVLLGLLLGTSFSQIDSLLLEFDKTEEDSSKLDLLYEMGWTILNDYPDSALHFANQGEAILQGKPYPYRADKIYRLKAFYYGNKNDRPKCLENHLMRINWLESTKEETAALSRAYFEVAAVFGSQGQDESAIKYYEKCRDVAYRLELKIHYGLSLISLSSFKHDAGDIEGAKSDLNLAFNICRTDSPFHSAYANAQLSDIYIEQDSLEKANELIDTALNIMKNDLDEEIRGFLLQGKGHVLFGKNQFKAALKYYNSARLMWEERNKFFYLQELYLDLAYTYAEIGSDSSSYFFKKHIALRDEAMNEDNNAQIAEMEAKYENVQNEKEIALLSKESEINELEAKRQSQISLVAIIGFILVLGLMIYVFSKMRVIRKQKGLIEERNKEVLLQKEIVEEKSKEITDSIVYAKRIQKAILPSQKNVDKLLPQNFIFYRPKDIVAGDFYWLQELKDGVLIAAADCTGHGVPGAMVSVVCNNGLNRSIREHQLTNPGEILDKTREIVIQEFEKSEDEVKDGMDIALCKFSNGKVQYAGAHNPLWIIRKDAESVEEYQATKQPIGRFEGSSRFAEHEVTLNSGDSIYIFTDGFADQFGGEKGKKFKTANLKNLLVSIAHLTMSEQHLKLQTTFEEWKGELEQLDDICFIGVRV